MNQEIKAGLGDKVQVSGLSDLPPVPSPSITPPIGTPIRDHPRADEPPREAIRPEVREGIRITDDGRQRQHTGEAAINPYIIDDIVRVYKPTNGDPAKSNIDNEIDFEWKRYEVYGQYDHSEWLQNESQGWRPVQHENFPGRFAPPGTSGMVRVKDMVLMQRPMRLTVQARNEEIAKATRTMQAHRVKVNTTPEGQAPRIVYTDKTSREAIEIPDK